MRSVSSNDDKRPKRACVMCTTLKIDEQRDEIIFSDRALIYRTFNPGYMFSDYSSLFIFGILTRIANEKQSYFILGNWKNHRRLCTRLRWNNDEYCSDAVISRWAIMHKLNQVLNYAFDIIRCVCVCLFRSMHAELIMSGELNDALCKTTTCF